MADNNNNLQNVVAKMIAAGESEENIKLVIENYKAPKVEEPRGITVFEKTPHVGYEDVAAKEKEANPLKSLGKSIYSTIAHQTPSTFYSSAGALRSLVGEYQKASGVEKEKRITQPLYTGVPVPFPGGYGYAEEVRDPVKVDKETAKGVAEVMKKALEYEEAGAKYTEDLVRTTDQIKDPLTAINWFAQALGQAAGQIPMSVGTMGVSAFMMETGEIYKAAVHKIAEERGLTVEQVIEQNLDDPASAMAYGTAAAGLEYVGAKNVLSAFKAGSFKNSMRRAVLSGMAEEGATEAAQTVIEQIGASRGAGKSWSDAIKDVDGREVFESAMAGMAGGGGISGIGATYKKIVKKEPTTKTEPEAKPAKVAESTTGEAVQDDIITDATKLGIVESQASTRAKESIDETFNEVKEEIKAKPTKEYSVEELTKEIEAIEETTPTSTFSVEPKEEKKEIYKERKEEKVEPTLGEPTLEGLETTEEIPVGEPDFGIEVGETLQSLKDERSRLKAELDDLTSDEEFSQDIAQDLQLQIEDIEQRIGEFKPPKEGKLGKPIEEETKAPERPTLKAVEQIKSKEGLEFTSNNYERKVKRALARKTITEEERTALEGWVKEYKEDVKKRQEARKPQIEEKIKERKEAKKKEVKAKPIEKYSIVSIRKFAKDEKHSKYKEAKDYLAKEQEEKQKRAALKQSKVAEKDDLGPAKPMYQKEKKVPKKAVKTPEKKVEKPTAETYSKIKGKTSAEVLTKREAEEVVKAKKQIEEGKLVEAAETIRKSTVSKSGLEEAQPVLIREISEAKKKLKKAQQEEKKEFQKAVREAEDKGKERRKWKGTASEKADFVNERGRKLKKIQEVHTETKAVSAKGKVKATKKELRDVIKTYNEFLKERGRSPLTEEQTQNLTETGNLQGDIIRSEEAIKEANEKKIKRIVSESKKDKKDDTAAFRQAANDFDGETLDGYFPNDDFTDMMYSDRASRSIENKIKGGKEISVSEFVSRYVKDAIGNNETFEKFLNLFEDLNKILGRDIHIVEAEEITGASGMYAISKNGNHYIVISKKGRKETGVHEAIHYLTTGIMNSRSLQDDLLEAGYSKEQIGELRDLKQQIDQIYQSTKNVVSKAYSEIKKIEIETDTVESTLETLFGTEAKDAYNQSIIDSVTDKILKKIRDTEAFKDINKYILDERAFVRSLVSNYVRAGKGLKDAPYGLESAEEFMAEAMSNPSFLGIINSIGRTENKKKVSVFDKLVDTLLKFTEKLTGISRETLDRMFKYSFAGETTEALSNYEKILRKPANERTKAVERILPRYEEFKGVVDLFYDQAEDSKDTDKMADDVSENAAKLAQLSIGKDGKRVKLNKERVKRLIKFVRSNDPSFNDLINVVSKINETLPDNKKITGLEVRSAFNRAKSEKKAAEKRKAKLILNRAEYYANIDLGEAKNILTNYIMKKLPSYKGYRRADFLKVLEEIKSVKTGKELKTHIKHVNELINDFKFDKAYDAANRAKNIIKSFKRSKLMLNEKTLWRKFKDMNLDLMSKEDLEEYTRLLNAIRKGRKDIKTDEEFNNWFYILDDMRAFARKYDKLKSDAMALDAQNTKEVTDEDLAAEAEEQAAKAEKKEQSEIEKRNATLLMTNRIWNETNKRLKPILERSTERQRELIKEFMSIKSMERLRDLSTDDFRNYNEGLRYLSQTGELTDKAGTLMTKVAYLNRKSGIDKLKGEVVQPNAIDKATKNIKTASQLSTFMGGFKKKVTEHINNLFFAKAMELDSKVHAIHKQKMDYINKLANDLRLKEENLVKIQLFSNIFTTKSKPEEGIEQYVGEINGNIAKYKKSLENLVEAAKRGDVSKSVSEAKKELDIFNELVKDLASKGKENVLTENEKVFRDEVLGMLEEGKSDFKQAVLGFANKPFEEMNEYVPTKAIGTVDGSTLGESTADIFKQVIQGNFDRLNEMESGFARSRAASIGGAYYDNNIINVLNKHISQSLYDSYMLPEIIALNKILTDKDIINTVGGENINMVRESLVKAVQRGRGNFEVRSNIVKGLETLKNLFVVGRMGTVFQLSTQLLTTIPAMGINNPKGFLKASSLIHKHKVMKKPISVPGHPDVKTLGDWINKFGHGLQNRDAMFERFESLADYSKSREILKKAGKKADDLTTAVLRGSDSIAATWTFLASYLEQGGTLEKPDAKKIAEAERQTNLLQNVSNPRFTSNLFRPNSDSQRVLASFLYTFKSFAVNQSINSLYALKHLDKAEARKLLAANAANIALYHIMSALISKMLGAAMGAFSDDDDEKVAKREKLIMNNFWEKVITRSAFDMSLAWLPQPVEEVIQEAYDKGRLATMEGITGRSYNDREERIFFDPSGSPAEHLGGYSGIAEPMKEFYEEGIKLAEGETDATSFLLRTFAESIAFMKAIPFRGDISRLLRTYNSIDRQKSKSEKTGNAKWFKDANSKYEKEYKNFKRKNEWN